MFDYRKLPFIILVVGVVLFAFSGLFTVLKVTNSGIKMDMYLCEPSISSGYFYDDYTATSVYYYPREYIYDKTADVKDICSYKRKDFYGNLTPDKFDTCRKTYVTTTKKRYSDGECKQIGKEILVNKNTDCEVYYLWGTKNIVNIKCVGGTPEQRKTDILKIKDKYK